MDLFDSINDNKIYQPLAEMARIIADISSLYLRGRDLT